MSTQAAPSFRFESPRHAGLLRLRVVFGLLASFVLCLCASQAYAVGSDVGTAVGIAGAIVFGMMALSAWRRSRSAGPPLVLDDDGLAVDDGLGESWRLGWQEIRGVVIERSMWRVRVVLQLEGETGGSISLPRVCLVDAPPEWVAGLIETFRERAQAGG